tara:strand:+ start:537 stop:728 length:192 start_codon:yes stop_codon:yes gene_type:complete
VSGVHIALAKAKKRIAELEESWWRLHRKMNRVHTYLENLYETQGFYGEFDYMDFQDYIEGEEE